MAITRGTSGGNAGRGGTSGTGSGGAESMAQSTSAEDDQRRQTPEEAVEAGTPDGTGADADVQFFDGTISKINKDGQEVMSDNLEAGEQLRRATTEKYAAVKTADRATANVEGPDKDNTADADEAAKAKSPAEETRDKAAKAAEKSKQ